MSETLDLTCPEVAIKTTAGADVTFPISLPFDATSGTHELVIAVTADGAAIKTLTNGDGLTVGTYADGVTPISVLINRTFTAAHPKERLFYCYRLTLSNLKRPYLKGPLQIDGDIT